MAIAFDPVGIDVLSSAAICAKSLSKPAKKRCWIYDPASTSSWVIGWREGLTLSGCSFA